MRRLLIASLVLLALLLPLSVVLTKKTQAAPNASWQAQRMPVTIRMSYNGRDYCVTTDGRDIYTWYCMRESGQALTSQQWQLIPRSKTTQATIRLANTSNCISANSTTGELTLVKCSQLLASQCWDIYDTNVYNTPPGSLIPRQPINPCDNASKSIQPIPNVFGYPNGVPIKVYSNVSPQLRWAIAGEGGYPIRIRSLWSSKCMTVLDEDNVVQSTCAIDDRQFFQLYDGISIPILIPADDGLLLCGESFPDNGDRPFECTGGDYLSDYFDFRAVGGYFQLRSSSSMCLDVNNTYPATQNGVPIQFWDCLGANQKNQLWYFERLVETTS